MSEITWTDKAWNVVTGCSPVSAGCAHCYAARLASGRLKNHKHYAGLAKEGKWTGEVRCNADLLERPLHWRKPRVVFVASTGDLFHPDVPGEFLFRVYDVMYRCPQHTFLVLTKREQSLFWHEKASDQVRGGSATGPIANIWLGVTAEDQPTLDRRLPFLLQTPAARRFLSLEPLLGPIVIPDVVTAGPEGRDGIWCDPLRPNNSNAINGVIVGGESGPGARPMHPDWARAIRDQCAAANVAFTLKQNGAWAPRTDSIDNYYRGLRRFGGNRAFNIAIRRMLRVHEASKLVDDNFEGWSAGDIENGMGIPGGGPHMFMAHIGKKAAGRKLDDVLHDDFPWSLLKGASDE